MKRFFLLLAVLGLAAAPLSAQQELVRLTRYEGERITGVSTSSFFRVELVQSEQTKAVVEIDAEWESYLRFSLSDEGIVTVGLRNLSRAEQREFNRLQQERRDPTLTLYLPQIGSIHLSGASRLNASGSFTGDNASIRLSGASSLQGLDVTGSSPRVNCDGGSRASLALHAVGELTVTAGGAARVELRAGGVTSSKIDVSGGAVLEVEGIEGPGVWKATGAGRIAADPCTLSGLILDADGGSTVRTSVSAGELTVTADGAARVELRAEGVTFSKISASGGSSVRIAGSGEAGDWRTGGAARITGEEFALRQLTVDASGGSSVRANVSENLTTRTSSTASVRYRGQPRLQNTTDTVRPL
jgi:hypothetical protein